MLTKPQYFLWYFALLLLITHSSWAEESDNSTESNEIIPRDAIKKLDYSVRQALLRAIDKLEQEADLSESEEEEVESTTENFVTTQSSVVTSKTEGSTFVPKVQPTVQFFTATLDEKTASEQLLSSFIDNTSIWQQKFSKTPLALSLGAPGTLGDVKTTPSTKHYQTLARSLSPSISTNEIFRDGSDEIQFEIRKSGVTSTTSLPRTTKKRKPTTTTTTTTTTPRPTHNEDGENIEIVDQQDIRIQEAPLVSAFTVNLDESGAAKHVVPIVHTSSLPKNNVENVSKKPLGPTIAKLQVQPNNIPIPLNFNEGPLALPVNAAPTVAPAISEVLTQKPFAATEATTQGQTMLSEQRLTPVANVNNFLIERQKRLEQEIYQLKLQAQQQQELILRQLKLLEENSKFSKTEIQPSIATVITPQQSIIPILQQQQPRNTDSGFVIRPSVEYISNPISKTTTTTTSGVNNIINNFANTQQLPIKENRFSFNRLFQQQQQLPIPNALQTAFQTQHLPPTTTQSSVQIQQANQINLTPLLNNYLQHQQQQQLPTQYTQQTFQVQSSHILPSYVTNAIQQKQQQLQQQQQSARLFRQEVGTANFGQNEQQPSFPNFIAQQPQQQRILPLAQALQQQPGNQHQLIENQNFYRQNLNPQLSNQLQQNAQYYQHQQTSALNHGINQFAPNNQHYKNNGF